MKKLIVCKRKGWFWVAALVVVVLAGIGLMINFEPFSFVIGLFMTVGSLYGITDILFGTNKAGEIWNYFFSICIILCGVALIGVLIFWGISSLFGINL